MVLLIANWILLDWSLRIRTVLNRVELMAFNDFWEVLSIMTGLVELIIQLVLL